MKRRQQKKRLVWFTIAKLYLKSMCIKYLLREHHWRPKWSPRSCLCNSRLGILADILGEYDYQALDVLSCMTLDVENCHTTVYSKNVNMSKLREYARSFGATMKENVKPASSWAAYYHTSRRSWYPKPDTTVSPHNVPLMMSLSVVNLPANDCDLLRNWASAYHGAAVRQKTGRQETTMAKHGTLPEYLYQRHLEVGDKVNLNFGVDEDEGPLKI